MATKLHEHDLGNVLDDAPDAGGRLVTEVEATATKRVAARRPAATTSVSSAHVWEFKARFRRNAFGWKSQPAIARIKQAVSEIKKVARRDPVLAAEGAVLFLERLSPALTNIDSSSGAIGTAVGGAIRTLVPFIAGARVSADAREAWLDRLWRAFCDDEIPYLEALGDYWGELCASPDVAATWADRLVPSLKTSWGQDRSQHAYFNGSMACFSALLKAGRLEQILELLERAPFLWWHYRVWGVRALAALGRTDDAIRYAEASLGSTDSRASMAAECELILLAAGRAEEAYRRYSLDVNLVGTYIGSFRMLAKRYPHVAPETLLADLVARTPGDEGKWFATAKELGQFDLALRLAHSWPADPKTLARAARDHAVSHPAFAIEVGMASLDWLAQGVGYDVTSADVSMAYAGTMQAAGVLSCTTQVRERLRALLADRLPGNFVTAVLRRELGI